jgi:hypothetical protein
MNRSHAFLLIASVAALLLALFQVWYFALPFEAAARVDLCRWSRHLDCFESLHRIGDLPVLAGLAALLFLQATLGALAAAADAPRREAWLGVARLVSFPASGLAIYVLLNDYLTAKQTSPTSVAIALLSLGVNVEAVRRGPITRLRAAGAGIWALLVAAGLLGFFLYGAASAARTITDLERLADAAPPALRWAEFEPEIPREGAVALGDPRAAIEILLFVDPAGEASRARLLEALELKADDTLVLVYVKGQALPAGARAYLEPLARGQAVDPLLADDPDRARVTVERIEAAARITEYPTAIWRGGRRHGVFSLSSIVTVARAQ